MTSTFSTRMTLQPASWLVSKEASRLASLARRIPVVSRVELLFELVENVLMVSDQQAGRNYQVKSVSAYHRIPKFGLFNEILLSTLAE